jgi:VWFA-related protein
VGVVFDTSRSMGDNLQVSQQAVAQFLRTANPEDEFFLIEFNDRPRLTVPFTAESEKLQSRLMLTSTKGNTALLDAVYLALHEMKKARNGRKAILVISDGGDNSSRYTEGEVRNAALEADVQIYVIGIFGWLGPGFHTTEEMAGPGLMSDLAERTGGRYFAKIG